MLHKLRSLASDTAVYGISTIIGRFLSFLLTPLYLNYLAPAEFGEVALLYSYIAFVNICFSFGMESAFFKFFSFENPEENKRVFSNAFWSVAVVSAVLTTAVCFTSKAVALGLDITIGGVFIQYAVLIAFFDALALLPFAALRMQRRSKRFAFTKFTVIAFNLLANLVLVAWMHLGIEGIFYAGLASSLLGVVLLAGELRSFLVVRIDKELLRAMAVFGLPTLPASFAAIVLQIADRPILQSIAGAEAVGMYQAAYKLGIPMMMAVTVFEYAWKPFFLQQYREPGARLLFSRVLTYFTLLCAGVFLVTGLFIEYIGLLPFVGGRFIPARYMESLGIIPIVLGAYYFLGVFTNLTAGVYLRKRTKYLPFITGAAAASNIVLNYALDPYYGMWGAAWATLGAYAVSAVLMYCLTRKIYPVRYEWGRITAMVLCTVAAFFVLQYTTAGLLPLYALFVRVAGVVIALGGMVFLLFSKRELAGVKRLLGRGKTQNQNLQN